MAESSGGFKWLKYGCLGCLGLVGLGVLLAAVLSGVAYLRVRAESVADRTLTPALPSTAPSPDAAGPDAPRGEAEPSGGGDEAVPPVAATTALPSHAGHVELDLAAGSFWIAPGRAGEPLRVEARYDENFYELDEQLTESDGGWSYRLGFRRTGSQLMVALKQMFGGTTPEVRIYLPPDRPIALELRLRQGGAEVELGGLWLTEADIEFGQSGVELGFGEPLRAPMESMALHGSMGGVNVSRLGNASPRQLSVDYNMGGMNLDLRGEWVVDSKIEITTRMSGTAVRLPEGVLIEGLEQTGVVAPAEPEIKPPTLSFTVSGEDIEFR